MAAYRLTFGASLAAAPPSTPSSACWSPGCWCATTSRCKRLFDALVDLPFALPTAVAGLVYSSLYVQSGWLGRFLVPLGIQGAYSRLGDRPGADLHRASRSWCARCSRCWRISSADVEEAAACLGANRAARPSRRVILPSLLAGVLTGFALAFARALGEYGSVVFVSGNMPFRTEIAPVLDRRARWRSSTTRRRRRSRSCCLPISFVAPGRHQPPGTLEQASWQLAEHAAVGPPLPRAHEDPAARALAPDRRWRSLVIGFLVVIPLVVCLRRGVCERA